MIVQKHDTGPEPVLSLMITLYQRSAATLQALFSSVSSLEALSKNSTLIFLQLLMRLVSSAQACILILNPFHKIIVVLIVNLPLHHHLQSVLSITQTETFPFSSATPLPGRELDGVRQGLRLGKNSQGQPWAGVEYSIRTKKEWDNKIFV